MKKVAIIIFITISIVNLNFAQQTFNLNAGIIKWGVSKLIGAAIKMIFSNAKDQVVEYEKKKLIGYLKKHPEHIDYAENLIKKQIEKYPEYSSRGISLLNDISIYSKSKYLK